MQVILLRHVRSLGQLGDVVKVKPGFARNHLFPEGKALPGTPENMRVFEERRAELQAQADALRSTMQVQADAIQGRHLEMMALASQEGKLYGSITAREVQQAITQQLNVEVPRKDVVLAEDGIHALGEYEVVVQFDQDIQATLSLHVVEQAASS